MASQEQLYNRLYDKLWAVAEGKGISKEQFDQTAAETLQPISEAIFEFLTQDIRVKEGIALSVASGIEVGDKGGVPPWMQETKEAGTGQTDEKGWLE